jgi:hypothetical protein
VTGEEATGELPVGRTDEAIAFLTRWDAEGWVLTAIDPARQGAPDAIQTQTFAASQQREATAWVSWWQGKRNIYFSVNRPKRTLTKKAEKADIGWLTALHVDLDPKDGLPIEDERRRIRDALRAFSPAPTVIVFSGGGYQAFWKLREPVQVDGPADVERLEAYSRALADALGGDKCHNIDRIMRLPGTVNLPTKKKASVGRSPTLSAVDREDWERLYSINDFAPAKPPRHAITPTGPAPGGGPIATGQLPEWAARLIAHGPDMEGKHSYGGDRSRAVFAVACALVRAGRSDDEVASVLTDPTNGISDHVRDQSKPTEYALRQSRRARDALGAEFARGQNGKILITQPNLRLALAKLGVIVSFDEFAGRLMIEGPDGEPLRELSDAEGVKLFMMIDEAWPLRPPKEFFWDFLAVDAQTRGRHPVLEYLDALRWDGERRLDRWLTTHAGAAETPYTRAVGAIVLIAAVRRVREPGCKFDEMVVLESGQGLDKSTGLAALAVHEEWFSDSLPLSADDRQVVEHLRGKWIVEASELKGMRRSDVEHLKSFLSRRVDRARLAYDRGVTQAPRQCVIVGTTNAQTYLRDVSGNRRFWPVAVSRLDVPAIKRDRDQLWAEAAAREAAGESIRLAPELYPAAAAEQEERYADDPWVAEIDRALGESGRVVADDLWALVDVRVGMRLQEHNVRLGEAMRTLGWERIKYSADGRVKWHYARGTPDQRRRRLYIRRGPTGEVVVSESEHPPVIDLGR